MDQFEVTTSELTHQELIQTPDPELLLKFQGLLQRFKIHAVNQELKLWRRRKFRGEIMHYFNFENVAKEAKIPKNGFEDLAKAVRAEFPRDEMMYELHLLRVCMSIQQGHVSLEEAIRSERAA